jgi:hypothetical protein
MVQDQDCKVGETHVQYGFQWWIAQWPLKNGLGSYPSEVVIDEYVEFFPGEKLSQSSVPGYDSRSTQNSNGAAKPSDQQRESRLLPK